MIQGDNSSNLWMMDWRDGSRNIKIVLFIFASCNIGVCNGVVFL